MYVFSDTVVLYILDYCTSCVVQVTLVHAVIPVKSTRFIQT